MAVLGEVSTFRTIRIRLKPASPEAFLNRRERRVAEDAEIPAVKRLGVSLLLRALCG